MRIEGSGMLGVIIVGISFLAVIDAIFKTANRNNIYLTNTHPIDYTLVFLGFLLILLLFIGGKGKARAYI